MLEYEPSRLKDGLLVGSSATMGWIGGDIGSPAGAGNGGISASAAFFLPLMNQDARFCLGLPEAVELLRFLGPRLASDVESAVS